VGRNSFVQRKPPGASIGEQLGDGSIDQHVAGRRCGLARTIRIIKHWAAKLIIWRRMSASAAFSLMLRRLTTSSAVDGLSIRLVSQPDPTGTADDRHDAAELHHREGMPRELHLTSRKLDIICLSCTGQKNSEFIHVILHCCAAI
jgi:hypothetical protein